MVVKDRQRAHAHEAPRLSVAGERAHYTLCSCAADVLNCEAKLVRGSHLAPFDNLFKCRAYDAH